MPSLPELFYSLLALVILALICGLVVKGLSTLIPVQQLLPPQRHRAVPWTGAEVWLVLLATHLLPLPLYFLLRDSGFLDWLYGIDFQKALETEDRFALERFSPWLQAICIPTSVILTIGLLRLLSGTRPEHLGLTLHRTPANLALGAMAWLAVTPLVFLVNYLVTIIYGVLVEGPPDQHTITRLVQDGALPVDWVLMVFLTLVAAPVGEELLFRGVLQRWLCQRSWGGDAAMVGAFLMALYQRANTLQEAFEQMDAKYILHELGPALFVVVLVPGYLWIDRVAGRLFPRQGQHTLPAQSTTSMPPPAPARSDSPLLDWYRLRVERPLGATPWNTARGIYGTAALFAMYHSNVWPSPIPLFILALVLGWLAHRTQSLIAPIVLHSLFNGVTCILLILSQFLATPVEKKGTETTSAGRRPPATSTSSFVPGSWLPRRI